MVGVYIHGGGSHAYPLGARAVQSDRSHMECVELLLSLSVQSVTCPPVDGVTYVLYAYSY